MKKRNFIYFLTFSLFLLSVSCSKDDADSNNEDEDQLVDPSNANAISNVLVFPAGSQTNSGNPPSPSSAPEAPGIDSDNTSVLSSNGSTAPLDFDYSNVASNLNGIYIQVQGSSSYVVVPLNSSSGSNGSLQIPIGIPTNVDEGTFCVDICVYDGNNNVSNIVTVCVSVLRLGTGSVQISLSWNTETDQDLHVIDPSGEEIYYGNSTSSTGGALDRDDIDGHGPENIYWEDSAPDGEYQVKVHDYEGADFPTSYYITVSGPNTSRNYSGTISNGATVDVVTFRKNGSNISF